MSPRPFRMMRIPVRDSWQRREKVENASKPFCTQVDTEDTGRPGRPTFYVHMDVAVFSDSARPARSARSSPWHENGSDLPSGHEPVQSAEALPDFKPHKHAAQLEDGQVAVVASSTALRIQVCILNQ